MHQTNRRYGWPILFGISAIAALLLTVSLFAVGTASAQTPSASPTASTTAYASPSATTTSSAQTAASPSSSASAVAPNTGSGVASTSSSSTMPFVLGGFAVVAGSLGLLGVSLRKRS